MKKKFTIIFLAFFVAGSMTSQNTYTYTGKPRFQILTKQNNAVLGIVNVELFPTIAPHHVRNFDSLVSQKFYDTTAFHRCVPGFVIQGGDPNSRHGAISTWGYGQPNQPTVNAEFSVAKHIRGSLSAARSSNINSATSQFFICVAATPNLNGLYSLYGRVTSGMTTVDAIVNTPKMTAPQYSTMPAQKIEMFVTYIGSNDTIPNPPVLTSPANEFMLQDSILSTTLKWNAVSDGIIYHVQVARDSMFTDSVAYADTPNLTYNLYNLDGYTTYYWRVLTNNGGHYSVYSPTWKFFTYYSVAGIKTQNADAKRIQVFPNPGSGNFTFSNLEKGDKIEVFDPLGKLIYSNAVKDSSFDLDLEGKEKGVYIYRVTNAQLDTKQGKFLLK